MAIQLKIEKGLDIVARFHDDGAAVAAVAAIGTRVTRTRPIEAMTAFAAIACLAKNNSFIYEHGRISLGAETRFRIFRMG